MISAARHRLVDGIRVRPGRRAPSPTRAQGSGRSLIGALEATGRIGLWFGWILLLMPVQVVAVRLDLALAEAVPVLFHRVSCRIFSIDIVTSGQPSDLRPTVFVSNHSSYLDIPILSCLIRGSFVAKAEIRDWPLVGVLARLQRSVFISRRVVDTRDARDQLARRLHSRHNLILFPEGTTNDGNRVLAFRTALFGLADDRLADGALFVQPLTIAYTHQNGMPIGHAGRARFAWFGDMSLAPHFWEAIRGGRITVRVDFHPPVEAAAFPARRALARHCYEAVAGGLERALHGRAPLDEAGADTHNSAMKNRIIGTV